MSANGTPRSSDTSSTTPTTRKRWPSASSVWPTAGRPSKNRCRVRGVDHRDEPRLGRRPSVPNGPPSRNVKSRIRQNSSSVRFSADAIFLPSTIRVDGASALGTIDSRSTPGQVARVRVEQLEARAARPRAVRPVHHRAVDIRACGPAAARVASGPNAWSNSAVTTISTSSVKLMPNRLMKVKNLRRSSTFTASDEIVLQHGDSPRVSSPAGRRTAGRCARSAPPSADRG